MRPVLLLLALGLSACAQANAISDANVCVRSAPPDQQAVWRMSAPGVVSTDGPISSGKYLIGGGGPGATNTARCAHQDDKGTAPQIHDLQKIG
jgi:hypothetical protein